MFVGIIGPGRLGRSLNVLLERAGHSVVMVRHQPLPADVHVALLTVPDQVIEVAAAALDAGPIVLHCSGATSLKPLATHAHGGSMHPLMTFPGPELGLPDLSDVVCAVDGDEIALACATTLAHDLGMRPVRVPGDRRLYHAAAVLAGNGATVLLAEAVRLLTAAGVKEGEAAAMLAPLVSRSIANAPPDPWAALTGPVARGDMQVVNAHAQAMQQAGLADIASLHTLLAEHAQRGIESRKSKKS